MSILEQRIIFKTVFYKTTIIHTSSSSSRKFEAKILSINTRPVLKGSKKNINLRTAVHT